MDPIDNVWQDIDIIDREEFEVDQSEIEGLFALKKSN